MMTPSSSGSRHHLPHKAMTRYQIEYEVTDHETMIHKLMHLISPHPLSAERAKTLVLNQLHYQYPDATDIQVATIISEGL